MAELEVKGENSFMQIFFSVNWVLFCVCLCFFSLGQYLNLDKDHNGMLSKEELSRYGTATLTSVFLDRVFQECLTYDGEMVRRTDSPCMSKSKNVWLLKEPLRSSTHHLFFLIVSPLCCRTTRPISTLYWLWKTGRSRQHCSTFSNFWTLRTKDTSMCSLSTISSGYQPHFSHTSAMAACKESIAFSKF